MIHMCEYCQQVKYGNTVRVCASKSLVHKFHPFLQANYFANWRHYTNYLVNNKPAQQICIFPNNGQILNIHLHSWEFSHKLTSDCKNWSAHPLFMYVYWLSLLNSQIQFSLPLSQVIKINNFGSAEMYLAHKDKYKNIQIYWTTHYSFASKILSYSRRIYVCAVPAIDEYMWPNLGEKPTSPKTKFWENPEMKIWAKNFDCEFSLDFVRKTT